MKKINHYYPYVVNSALRVVEIRFPKKQSIYLTKITNPY